MKIKYLIIIFLLAISLPCLVQGQAIQQREPDPNTGDVSMLRIGIMDGNRIATRFKNWGEIAEHPFSPSCESLHGRYDSIHSNTRVGQCSAA